MSPITAIEKEDLFTAIVSDNRRLIYKVCYMYATDDEHFNDLYQEVLANIWQGIESFRGESRRSTWIYRVALNTCVTFFRRNSPHTTGRVSLDALSDIAAPDSSRGDMLREMYRLIGNLPKMDKALILMWLDEKSYDEIAEVTGLTRNTVATRLRRIKLKLIEQNNK